MLHAIAQSRCTLLPQWTPSRAAVATAFVEEEHSKGEPVSVLAGERVV
jgi:hypothetical protein